MRFNYRCFHCDNPCYLNMDHIHSENGKPDVCPLEIDGCSWVPGDYETEDKPLDSGSFTKLLRLEARVTTFNDKLNNMEQRINHSMNANYQVLDNKFESHQHEPKEEPKGWEKLYELLKEKYDDLNKIYRDLYNSYDKLLKESLNGK
jgi:hypothetical protein